MTPELANARFKQPAAFVAGSDDDVLLYDPDWRENFPKDFDDLQFIEIIEGAGHWIQAEKPAETTAEIVRFLREIDAGCVPRWSAAANMKNRQLAKLRAVIGRRQPVLSDGAAAMQESRNSQKTG